MICNLPLFFLFSVTATLLLPSSSHVNFNTSSLLQGKKHSSSGSTTINNVDEGSKEHYLKVDYVLMASDDRKNCSSGVDTASPESDGDSTDVAGVTYRSMKLSLPPSQVRPNVSVWSPPSPSLLESPSLLASSSSSPSPSLLESITLLSFSPSPSIQPAPSPIVPSPSPFSPSSPSPSPFPIAPAPAPSHFSPTTISPRRSLSPPVLDEHQSSKRNVIIGVIIAVIGGLAICIIICYFRYKSLSRLVKFCLTTKTNLDIEAFLSNHGAVAQKRYKFSEVKKMTNSFKVKLGQGGFGAVYKGKLPTGSPVAVKLLNIAKRNGEDFINEVASISRTSHVNIVALLGFCLEGRKKALIYEFMANGSLDKFIYKTGPETIASLSWENLYQISIGIARGLEYLHRGCNTRILHFDIKPHNILLDENFCPKISDFGLAKLCPKKESIISMSDTRGTMGYVSPEMCNRHFGGISHKSDVYSFGMMILEMVGGRKNINAEASHTSEIYFPHLVYSSLELDNDLRPDEVMTPEENEIARRMTIVGLWCIQTFPNDRPTMSRVVDMLEGNMNSLEMPPKPMFSSPARSSSSN